MKIQQKTESQRNFPFGFRLFYFSILLSLPLSWSIPRATFAEDLESHSAHEVLQQKASALEAENQKNGWAYILSGGLALGISIPAYYLSQDLVAKVVYSVGQTVSVGAVGYGSYLVLLDNDYRRFEKVIEQAPAQSTKPFSDQKDQLSYLFLKENAQRSRNIRKIRVITHSLTAALNFVNGATTSQRELQTALYFIGGVNALAALSFGFGSSEEEKISESIKKPELAILAGPLVGFCLHF